MTTTFYWHDWAGYVGVALVLLAHLLLQAHKLHGNGLTYQLLNVVGAAGILTSLSFGSFNMSAFLMEAAWLLISLYGIARARRLRRQQPSSNSAGLDRS